MRERMRIAAMGEDDLVEVMRIENSRYPFPWTLGNFRDSLRAGYRTCCLRDPAERLLAYAVLMIAVEEAHLLNITVAADAQGRGLGRWLLDHMVDHARVGGALAVLLEVRPSNERALRLYERYGFDVIGCRRGYYPAQGGREDAIVMRIAL
jgi:ribosomal-protein-alanine N-acetyltransferase